MPKPIRFSASGSVDFDINWPPRPPARQEKPRRSLLSGQLLVRSDISQKNGPKVFIALLLIRPHATEADREFWNAETEFRQYKNWMPYVRGRDAKGRQWLWPNLAYLFRARGADRVERYGGWDKGHRVDNDFGGVLIRKLGRPAGPLVSADWRPANTESTSGLDVAHYAESDTFTLHPGASTSEIVGAARLWFIYGDFMTRRPPWKYAAGPMKGRPLKKEHSGGIIAQFRINWVCEPDRPIEFEVTQETPRSDTGFNWRSWINRKAEWDTPEARPRLTD